MTAVADLKRRLATKYQQRESGKMDGYTMPLLEEQIRKLEKQLKRIDLHEDPVVHLAQIQKRLKWLKNQIGIYEFEYAGLTTEANTLQDAIEAKRKEGGR